MNRGRGYRGGGPWRGRGGPSGPPAGVDSDDGDDYGRQGSGNNASSMTVDQAVAFFRRVDGQNYGILKDLTGTTIVDGNVRVVVRRVQADPFAPGSQFSATVQFAVPGGCGASAVRRVACEDLLLRRFVAGVSANRAIEVLHPSQHVLERSALRIEGAEAVTVHLRAKLPGHGRRIDGRGCLDILQRVFASAAALQHVPAADLQRHADSVEDQEWLRRAVAEKGLVAFVPDGAILPRASGVSDGPLPSAVPFSSPPEFRVSFDLPNARKPLAGMGLPRGITVIVGGGFHGKSTLLRALEMGIYNHVPGDGREFVVCEASAVKIRSEDRRAVTGVDISAFIRNIPFGRSTAAFATADASGSTSQAANIVEALELGASCLLIDEDTSATNFMARDAVMRSLITGDMEPITPLVERVAALRASGVSTVLVAGGSSAFLQPADHIIQLHNYAVVDLTQRAKAASAGLMAPPAEAPAMFPLPAPRSVDLRRSFAALTAQHRAKCSGTAAALRLADEDVPLDKVEQLVEDGQGAAIAMCLAWLAANGPAEGAFATVPSAVDRALAALTARHLEIGDNTAYFAARGFVALPRRFELGAALNRIRTLAIKGLL